MLNPPPIHALLIAGRSGVGKTTVSYEVSEILRARDISHVLVDGDNLDAAWPKPAVPGLTEANLAALWANYRTLGHHRTIYVNTVSVLESDMIRRALGDPVRFTGILLTADDQTILDRLATREVGTTYEIHVERSARAAAHLDASVDDWVHRVSCAGRSVSEIADEIVTRTGSLDGVVG